MKQYVGISRDHSGSMSSLRDPARRDYNENIAAIKNAANENKVDTIVSVVRCGIKNSVDREVVNSNVQILRPLDSYQTDGNTPLFDSVGELIDLLSKVPDADDPNVSFLVMAVTDGEENASKHWTSHALTEKFRALQATDRWTFVFRVPRGYKAQLARLGVPEGNIQEWEQTERGMRESSVNTQSAVASYYSGIARGVRSTDHFYANAKSVTPTMARQTLTDISQEVSIWPVVSGGSQIRSFVESKITPRIMDLGSAFYQLTKTEREVQSYKLICIREKSTGRVYGGQSARNLLGLPLQGTIRLSPGDHGDWDIYVQSTSNNRLLIAGTNVLYWEAAGKPAVRPRSRSASAR
jgi:hypothetical protein